MASNQLLELLEKYRVGYNEVDIPALEKLVSENIKWGHRNKFRGSGRTDLMRSIKEFAGKTPGRYFDPPHRYAINGQTVFSEQTWHAVPAHSDPAWGWEKGVPFSMDTCSIFVFQNNQIAEWSDFG